MCLVFSFLYILYRYIIYTVAVDLGTDLALKNRSQKFHDGMYKEYDHNNGDTQTLTPVVTLNIPLASAK